MFRYPPPGGIKIMSPNGEFKLFAGLAAILWLALASPRAFPQEAPGSSKIISIDFKGGSVAEYVTAVADAANKLHEGDFNVVVDGEAVVHDQPDILARTTIVTSPLPPETFIGDAELLALLAKARRPSGLIRIGGRAMLTDNRNHPTHP